MKRATRKLLSLMLVLSMLLSLLPTAALAEGAGALFPPTQEEEEPPVEQQAAKDQVESGPTVSIDSLTGKVSLSVTFKSAPATTTSFTIALVPNYTFSNSSKTGDKVALEKLSTVFNPGSASANVKDTLTFPGEAYIVQANTALTGKTLTLEDGSLKVDGNIISATKVSSTRGAMSAENITQSLKEAAGNSEHFAFDANKEDISESVTSTGYPYVAYVYFVDNSYVSVPVTVTPATAPKPDLSASNITGTITSGQRTFETTVTNDGNADAKPVTYTLNMGSGSNPGFVVNGSSKINKDGGTGTLTLDATNVTERSDTPYTGTITISCPGAADKVITFKINYPTFGRLETTTPSIIATYDRENIPALNVEVHQTGATEVYIDSVTYTGDLKDNANVAALDAVKETSVGKGWQTESAVLMLANWSSVENAPVSGSIQIAYTSMIAGEGTVNDVLVIPVSLAPINAPLLVAAPVVIELKQGYDEGTIPTTNIVIENTGDATGYIDGAGASGNAPGFGSGEFELSSLAGLDSTIAIAAGDTTEIQFTPQSGLTETKSDTLKLHYQDDPEWAYNFFGDLYIPITVKVTASATPTPKLSVSPGAKSWTYKVGETPALEKFTITNSGDGKATSVTAELTGADAGKYTLSDYTLSDIGDKDSGTDTAEVTVTPKTQSTVGDYTDAQLVITYSGGDVTDRTVKVNLAQFVDPAAPTTGSVEVTLHKNNSDWTDAEVYLSNSNSSAGSNTVTYVSGKYTFSDVAPGDYYVWVVANGSTAELASDKITVTAGGIENTTVNYYGLKVAAGVGGSVSPAGQDSTAKYYPAGATQSVTATATTSDSQNKYAFSSWASSDSNALTAPAAASDTITISGANWNSDVTLTASFKAMSADSVADQDWSVTTGYSGQTAKTITYWNPGSANTGMVTASITGTDVASFEIIENGFGESGAVLTKGGTDSSDQKTVAVNVKTGLSAKTYTATLRVTDGDLTIDVPLKLTVTNPATFNVKVATYPDGDAAANVGTVELVRTVGTGATPLTGTFASGNYEFTNVGWDSTYTVYVNGLGTGMTITNTDMGRTVEVKNLYTVGFSATSYDGDKSGTPAQYSYTPDGGSSITGKQTITVGSNKVIPGGKDLTVAANAATDGTGGTENNEYYRFNKWTATGGGTFGSDAQDSTAFTTPAGDAESGITLTPSYQRQYQVTVSSAQGSVTVAVGEGSAAPYSAPVLVDAGGSITLAVTGWSVATHAFKDWTSSNGGSFTPSITTATGQTFTPTGDTTVSANFNTLPTLSVSPAIYDFGPGAAVGERTPYTLNYDPKDGTLSKFTVTYGSTTVDAPADAFSSVPGTFGDSGAYVFKADWFKANFGSAVNATGGMVTFEAVDSTSAYNKTATATLKQTPLTLTSVTIAAGGTTAVGDTIGVTGYESDQITGTDITYIWYNAPYGTDMGSVTLDAGGVPSVGTAATGTATGTTYTLNADDMGKIVFAVGHAQNSGTGYAKSNAVAVNYDAAITVQVDGVDAGAGYTVALVNKDDSGDVKSTTHSGGTYNTTGGALKAGAEYKVMVQRVGKSGAAEVDSGKTVTIGSRIATVDYYAVKFTSPATVTPIVGSSVATPGEPALTAAVAGTAINDEAAVLTGTAVTFTVDDWSNAEFALTFAGVDSSDIPARTATKTYSAKATDPVTATIAQKGYEIKGTVDDTSRITGVTLKDKASPNTVFSGTVSGGTYTFTGVPMASYEIVVTLANSQLDSMHGSYNKPDPLAVTENKSMAFALYSKGNTYHISLNGGADDAPAAGTGSNVYNVAPTAVIVTVKSTGTSTVTGLTYTLGGNDSGSFALDKTGTATSLASNEQTTFKLTPTSATLNVGTYVGTVTVNGAGLPGGGVVYTYTYTVTKATNAAPDVTPTGCITYGGSDGKLTIAGGAAGSYDYSTNGGTTWTTVTAGGGATANEGNLVISGLPAGTQYQVRVMPDTNHISTATANITILDGTKYTGQVTVCVDGVGTGVGINKVEFVDKDSTTVDAAYTEDGVYKTAANALDLSKDDYTIRITTAKGTYTYTTKIVNKDSRSATADLNKVLFSNATVAGNVYAKLTSAAISAKVSTAPADVTGLNAETLLATGDLVPAGTGVTFTIDNTLDAKYDYSASWTNATPSGSQTNAKGAQATVSYSGTGTGAVTAALTLNTYTVRGTVDTPANFATVTISGKTAEGMELSANFNATIASGANGTYFLNVPASDASGYTVTAYAGDEAVVTVPTVTGVAVAANHTIGTPQDGKFSFTSTGARYELKLGDGGYTATADKNNPGSVTNPLANLTYGYNEQGEITLTVSNTGNMPLYNVKLTTTSTGTGASFAVAGGDKTDLESGVTLAAFGETGDTKSFTIKPNEGMNAGSYTFTATINATTRAGSEEAGYAPLKPAEYKITLTVDKAEINAAAVTVEQPVANGTNKLADGVIVTANPKFEQVTTWNSGSVGGSITAGTVYTATVKLTPTDTDNYKFVAGNYTINTVSSGANVTVNQTPAVVTLTYTFPPTAPSLILTAQGTDYDKITATATVTGSGAQTVQYTIKTSEGEPSETDWNNTTGSFTGLSSYTTYHVYARAKVGDSDWSAVAHASAKTFHKVTVYAGAGALVQPTPNPKGVGDGATLDIQVTPPDNHKFTSWSTDDRTADITPNTNPGTYTATSASAAEVTLTANYEAGYGVQYDANSGSGTTTDSKTYYSSESITTQANGFNRQGYTFMGWGITAAGDESTNVAASGTIAVSALKAAQSGVDPGGKFTLYALWQMNTPVIVMPSDGATAYGATGYSYGAPTVSNSGDLANTAYTWSISDSEKYGMAIDSSTGVISGRATKVGDIILNVAVSITAGSETKISTPVPVKIVAGKADISGTPSYAAGNYYAGDAVNQANLSGTVTAPYWDSSNSAWDEAHVVTGTWGFTSATEYTAGTNVAYDVTYTVNGTDAPLYKSLSRQVQITADAKTYGLELVDGTNPANPANGTFTGGHYLDTGTKEVKLKVKNTGNQAFELTEGSYALSGTDSAVFEVSTKATGTVKGINDDPTEQISDVVVIQVKEPNKLNAGTYTATLTVTSSTGQSKTLSLSYTVGKKEIPSTAITGLTAPAKNGTPTTASGLNGVPTVADSNGKTPFAAQITWNPADTAFKPGTAYTATVVLTADNNYYFADYNNTTPNHTITTSGTTSHTVNVATDATSSTVTFTEVFTAIPMTPPTVTPAATAYNAGKVTITGQDAEATVKFLVSTSDTATADAVWASGTVYTGMNQALGALQPNTVYYLHAVAGNDAGGTAKSTVTTGSFKTPYQVDISTDGKGTVAVDSGTARSIPQTFSVYADAADVGATGIPASLSLEVAGDTNYAFKNWTDASNVIRGTGPSYTLTPSGSSPNTITVTANFTALYTIAFHANGGKDGTLPGSITNVKVGDEVTLPAPSTVFTKNGYTSLDKWATNVNGTENVVDFSGEVTITAEMVNGLSAGDMLTFYHAWESNDLFIQPETLNAVYNMDQSDWTAAGTAHTGITIKNGSGPYSDYKLEEISGQLDPTGFLEITDSGVIQLKFGARMGDAKTYKFTVSVKDTGKDQTVSATFTLTVAKATPQIASFTYATGTNYYGDDVVWPGKITAVVKDQYDTANTITTKGGWKAAPGTFQDKAGGTTNYTFTFEVIDATLKDNYRAADTSVNLSSEERKPDMAVATSGKSDHSATYVETNSVTYDSTAGVLAVTAELKNTGNDVFDTITVTETSDTDNLADGLSTTGILTPLAVNHTGTFTFNVNRNKAARTAPYEATFTIVGKNNASGEEVTITYTYRLTVNPVELDHATLTGLTAPAAGGPPVSSVTKADGTAYNALYTVKTVTWTGDLKDGKFQPGVAYTANITLEPTDTTNYVFVNGTYKLDSVEATASGAVDATNGGKVSYVVSGGTVTITHTYDVLPVSGVTGVLAPVDYQSAKITSLQANSGVRTRLYYALFATAQSGITAEEIKTAAVSGTYNSVSAVLGGYGSEVADSVDGVAQWTGEITVSGLTGGVTYYLYVAAQPESEIANANGLAMGSANTILGKMFTVSANEYGKVTYSTDEVAANGNKVLTMTADDSFTAAPTDTAKFGFAKWKLNSTDVSPVETTYGYVLNSHANGDTLNAIFHRKLNGTFAIDGTPGKGVTLSAGLGAGTLLAGSEAVTPATPGVTYQWNHKMGTGAWEAIGAATDSTYTIPNDGTYAGHAFQLVVSYTDPANGGSVSTVSAETGVMTLKLDAPVPVLTTAQSGSSNSATAVENEAGGLYVTFPKIAQDSTADQKVAKYQLTLKKDGTQVGTVVEITANGDATYSYAWPADLASIVPGSSFTVSIVAVTLGSNGYENSEPGTGTATAGYKTLTVADLTGTLSDKVFNGAAQTGGTITAPAGAGTVTVKYDNSDGSSKTADKTNVNLDNSGKYDVYVTVAQGSLYLALAETKYQTGTPAADAKWAITQAGTTLSFAHTSLAGKTGVEQNLATGAAPKVTYTSATGSDDLYETGGTVTSHYTLAYAVTASPNSDGSDYTLDAATGVFTPNVNGTFTITVTAGYKGGETQLEADLALPAAQTFQVTVQDKVLTSLEILSTDRTATYGTTDAAVYYDAAIAASAKQMGLEGVQIRLTWDNASQETITLDSTASNAGGIVFTSSLAGSLPAAGKINFPAAGTTVLTATYLGMSGTMNFALNPKALNYHTTGADKVYDGTDAVTTPGVAFDDGQTFVNDTTPAADAVTLTGLVDADYALSSANVGNQKVQIRSASLSKLALTGAQAGYYALGGRIEGAVEVTAVTIASVKVTTQTPTAGGTIIKTIDSTNNKITDKDNSPLTVLTGTPTITWQEKDGSSWKTTTDSTFQAGKEYRPVVTVTANSNYKLAVNNDYTINTNKHGQNSAEIIPNHTNPGNTGTFTGAPTALPGIPVLKFQDVNQSNAGDKKDAAINVTRTISVSVGATLGKYTVTLSNSGEVIYDVDLTNTGSLSDKINLVPATIDQMNVGGKQDYTLDLSGVPTNAAFVGQVIITAIGAATDGGTANIQATYTLNLSITSGGGGSPGGGGSTELAVTYDLQDKGTSKDALSESVASGQKPVNVPAVTAKKGYIFKGWSQSDPSKTQNPTLVDPKTVTIKAATTFYAVYAEPVTGEHEHYIKGYDTGIFGPTDNITRAQVAAIIARACLDGFHEDNDYGNGGYTDVANDHWARSAIAFVTTAGVFEGDGEGHFDPDRAITRQEFALVFARMAGMLSAGETPFSDAATTAEWAVAGVYTAYAKGWLDGYNDGTFKPWNNILRSEAVKIVNRYLNRGVNAEGIVDVYSELKQWPDVPATYWAYYEILEASNDHTYFYVDGKKPPEVYTKAYIETASWGK